MFAKDKLLQGKSLAYLDAVKQFPDLRPRKKPGVKSGTIGEEEISPLVKYNSLVKYNTPYVSSAVSKKKATNRVKNSKPIVHKYGSSHIEEGQRKVSTSTCKQENIEMGLVSTNETEDVLNFIIPPITWKVDGVVWKKNVSSVPPTRNEIIRLSETLDKRLKDGNSRATGLDHFRRAIFKQLFDELIRQCTIQCAEHGLLLFRIRNEIQMTINCYETLYKSGISYGIKKALQAESEKEKFEKRKTEDALEINELKKTAAELKGNLAAIELRNARRRDKLIHYRKEQMEAKQREIEETKLKIWAILFPKSPGPTHM